MGLIVQGGKWRLRAACRDFPPELFFSNEAEDVAGAKEVCGLCPVRSECLEDSYETADQLGLPIVDGVWGGLDKDERARKRLGMERQIETEEAG